MNFNKTRIYRMLERLMRRALRREELSETKIEEYSIRIAKGGYG
jgi:hypothetical protein